MIQPDCCPFRSKPALLGIDEANGLQNPRRRAGQKWIFSAAIAVALGSSGNLLATSAFFEGDSGSGTPGDNATWASAANWRILAPNPLPSDTAPGDDLTFGTGTAGGVIDLGGARIPKSLTFNKTYTLGLPSTTNTLTLTSPEVSVRSWVTATINAPLAGSAGLNLTGGGTLVLNPTTGNTFTGDVNISDGDLMVNHSAALGTGTKTITFGDGTAGTPQLLLGGGVTLPQYVHVPDQW